MGQTTLILMILTVISKIFGFVRESVMAAYIGAGELKSIYTTAITIPAILNNVIASGILTGFIPTYNKIINDSGEEDADKFTSNIINILFIIGTIFLLLVLIFARYISIALSPKLSGDWLYLASTYTRIMIFSVYAFFYASITKGYLNIKGNFVDPILSNLIFNVLVIIFIVLYSKYDNPLILIIGTLMANVLQFIRLPWVTKKYGYNHKFILDFSDRYIRYLLIMVIPIIISSAADEISLIIDNSMASAFFGVASISKIFYAKSMLRFILGVVTFSVATVTFPEIAKLGQKGDIEPLKNKITSSLILSMVLVIPATIGMMVLSRPIIQIAFERNAFTNQDTLNVSSLLLAYGPYIIFASIIRIMSNGYYSLGDAKTPVIIVIVQQILNVILNFISIKFFGIEGLAYSTCISTAIGSVLLLFYFNIKYAEIVNIELLTSIAKILFSSLLMGLLAYIIFSNLQFKLIISLLLTVLICSSFYMILIINFKIEQIQIVVEDIKIKLNNLRPKF